MVVIVDRPFRGMAATGAGPSGACPIDDVKIHPAPVMGQAFDLMITIPTHFSFSFRLVFGVIAGSGLFCFVFGLLSIV